MKRLSHVVQEQVTGGQSGREKHYSLHYKTLNHPNDFEADILRLT